MYKKLNLHLFLFFTFGESFFESLHAFYDFLERKIVAVHLIIHAQLCYIHSWDNQAGVKKNTSCVVIVLAGV